MFTVFVGINNYNNSIMRCAWAWAKLVNMRIEFVNMRIEFVNMWIELVNTKAELIWADLEKGRVDCKLSEYPTGLPPLSTR